MNIAKLIYTLIFNVTGANLSIRQIIQGMNRLQAVVVRTSAIMRFGAANFNGLVNISNKLYGVFRRVAAAALSIVAIIGTVGAATMAITRTAGKLMQMAADYDLIKTAMEGYYQSGDKANQMMLYLDRYAAKSAFSLDALAKAAAELSAAGLDVNRFLPIAERLSLALGEMSPENLESVAGVLRRIKGGQVTLGMGPRGLGRFGIGKDQLSQYGAKWDAGGSFIGSVDEAMDIIERLVADRLSKTTELIEKTDSVIISNAGDAWARALRAVGRQLNKGFLPTIKMATDALNTLVESGAVASIGESIASMFAPDNSEDLISALIHIGAMFEGIAAVVRFMINGIVRAVEVLTRLNLGKILGGGSIYNDAYDTAVKRMEGIMYAYNKRKKKPKGAPEGAPELPYSDEFGEEIDTSDPSIPILAQIERNTKDALDIQRHVFGGGDVARAASSPMEINRLKNSVGTGRGWSTHTFGSALAKMIESYVQSMISEDRVRYARGT